MRRRTLSIREARAEADAAEARGLPIDPRPARRPSDAPARARETPKNQPRLRVVWTVCDVGGRTVATFPYPEKTRAEAHAAALEEKGRGAHFVRSEKEPMNV
jgi:hypothetical protein